MFSAPVLEHSLNPCGVGPLSEPDGEGRAGSTEIGEYTLIQVRLTDLRVEDAAFRTFGCAAAIAAASYVVKWVRGRDVGAVWELTPAEVEAGLGGLPERRRFCARLAVQALHRAVRCALGGGEHAD